MEVGHRQCVIDSPLLHYCQPVQFVEHALCRLVSVVFSRYVGQAVDFSAERSIKPILWASCQRTTLHLRLRILRTPDHSTAHPHITTSYAVGHVGSMAQETEPHGIGLSIITAYPHLRRKLVAQTACKLVGQHCEFKTVWVQVVFEPKSERKADFHARKPAIKKPGAMKRRVAPVGGGRLLS